MYKSFTKTVATTTAVDMVVECGFVPSAIRILNVDTGNALFWSDKMAAGTYVTFSVAGDPTTVTGDTNGITLIDGSDKTNNVTSSFGFVIKNDIAGINADAVESDVLIIEVFREDGV